MEQVSVFLVEDQPQLLKQLLKSLSLYPELTLVGSSQDGEDAVSQIVRLLPQLVLLDLELPGLNGIEVTKRVKAKAPEVEILVLTSFDDELKVYDAIRAGAAGYLVKRVGPDRIRGAIQEVMAGGTVLEAKIAKRFWNFFQSVQAKKAVAEQNPWGLTEVERELLHYIGKGLSNAQVGELMSLERRTVRTHLAHIYEKMGVHSHVEAVVRALGTGLIQL
jgi:DNA-binding NarL/FixJ family response regulator